MTTNAPNVGVRDGVPPPDQRWPAADRPAAPVVLLLLLFLLPRVGSRDLPFLDRTEARVGLIAQNCAATGNLFSLTLTVNGEDRPYWAKPPLHYWLVSFSYRLAGVSAAAARLPSALEAAMVIAAAFAIARRAYGRRCAVLSSLLLASNLLFLAVTNLALIDSSLLAGLTVALWGFTLVLLEPGGRSAKLPSLLCGTGLAVAGAAKGPVGLALPVVSVILFRLLAPARPPGLLRTVTSGYLVATLLLLPYYYLIEVNNPGWLRYFLLNENLLRYVSSDYGARTGSGHSQIPGSSWLFLAVGFLPWTPRLTFRLWQAYRARGPRGTAPSPQAMASLFLLCWAAAPALLFMVARNHLPSYLLPGVPALAVWLASRERSGAPTPSWLWRWEAGAVPGIALLLAVCALAAARAHTNFEVIFTFACVALLLALFRFRERVGKNGAPVVGAVAVVLGVSGSVQGFEHQIDDYFSSRQILSTLEVGQGGPHHVCFPYEAPYSANLYLAGPRVRSGQDCLARAEEGREGYFVVRTKHVNEFERRLGAKVVRSHADGKWVVYAGRGQTPPHGPRRRRR